MPSSTHVDVYERVTKEDIRRVVDDRRMVRMIRSFMQRSSEYREPFLELARKSREVYENWQGTSRSIIQRANIQLPFGYTIIETQLPQLVDVFFKDDKIISFRGQNLAAAEVEDDITDFHKKQMNEMKITPKSIAFMKSMLLDGTAISKVPYRFQEILTTRKQTTVDPTTGESTFIKIPQREVLYDGPDLELLSIFDFYPDWSMKQPGEIQKMRGCVHRTWRTWNSLKQAKIYKNLDQVRFSVGSKGSAAWSSPYYSGKDFKYEFERLQDNDHQNIKDPGKIEVWEYWGLYDPKGDGKFVEYLIVIANGDVVIRDDENFYDYKFKPFVACPNYIRDNEFYGIPELLALRPLIKEANTLRNARLDNVNLSVNPMWLADRASGINARSLYSRPSGIIWTNDINGIKPLQIPDPSSGSFSEIKELQVEIQNASGIVGSTPVLGQMAKTFGRSATGAAMVGNLAANRVGLKARLLNDYYFKPIAWIMLMTNRQFVVEGQPIRSTDPNAAEAYTLLPPEAFFRRFHFTVNTDLDTGGVDGQLQKMQAVSQILSAAENSQPGVTRADVLLEAMLRPILGPQVPRFVRSDEERSELQAQQLAATQQVNAAQGQAAPQPNELAALLGPEGEGQ